MKLYSCQFAPNAETWRDAIRVGQLVHDRGVNAYESFAPQAFEWTKAADVPILLDHDTKKRAGTVTVKVAHGDWHRADFVLDGPYAARAAEYIERCGKVSPSFTELTKDPISARAISPAHNPTHWYTRARLNEISIVSPGGIAWYQGAKVTRASELRPATPARSSPVPEPAGEVIFGDGTLVRRVYATPIVLHDGRQVIVNRPDGSQELYSSEAEYQDSLRAGMVGRL